LRTNIVLGLLAALTAGTIGLMATRDPIPHAAPAGPAPSPSASAGAGPATRSAGDGGLAIGLDAGGADAGADKLIDRPLRAAVLGWDLAAPAVLANGGLDPTDASAFTAAGVTTYLRVLDTMSAVEGALARGGGDRDGADIAVVPLSELAASYERLRALSPEVFFVVGWSHGREALLADRDKLPGTADRPDGKASDKTAMAMVGTVGEPAAFLGLFALDANGIPSTVMKLVARTDNPDLAAVDRDAYGDAGRKNIVLTTADASRLVPFVAVAQHGLVDQHPRALVAWSRVWVEAARKLDADPPAAARAIASAHGAPEPITLLKRLGEITPASLSDNARAFALSGRGAVTLDALFQQGFRIWRGLGALAMPPPDTSPINGSIVAALVRASPALAASSAPRPKAPTASPDTLKALLTYKQAEGKVDLPALLAETGLLADVFERSVLRLAVTKGGVLDAAASKRLADDVVQRFDVAPERLVVAKKAPPKTGASVEVLVAP
jgi:hypothetical protein